MDSSEKQPQGACPLTGTVAISLLYRLRSAADLADVMQAGLEALVAGGCAAGAGVVRQQGRRWSDLAWAGEASAVDRENVIAEAMDRRELVATGRTTALPLEVEAAPPHLLLVVDWKPPTPEGGVARRSPVRDFPAEAAHLEKLGWGHHGLAGVANLLAIMLGKLTRDRAVRRRAERLETTLRIGADWSGQSDTDNLLESIAEAATELLGAERASIFLWERSRKVLIGRPALGVDGNVLEVPDSAGVVGAVLQSGQPKRWHAGDDAEREVNRSVDKQLQFETRSLLAVPLWAEAGGQAASRFSQAKRAARTQSGGHDAPASPTPRPLGVFEVINRRAGEFTAEDEIALADLATLAAAAIQNAQVKQELAQDRDRLVDSAAESARVIGQHSSIIELRKAIERVAGTDLSVLILGENGTGKEVLARSIHFQSDRKHQPFVAVNCAALVESLLESELFGHEKGAFTDAHQERAGKFEAADGGTLFLDEVGDLSPGGQAKLLRVLEDRKVTRVGATREIPVDVRVVAATNQPLAEMVRQKKFREDLYFRLNIVTLEVPPLRERGEDVLLLAEHFLHLFSHQVGRRPPRLTAAARNRLLAHRWSGNVRELRNMTERLAYLCPGSEIDAADLELRKDSLAATTEPQLSASAWQHVPLAEATREFQVRHIEAAIEECGGRMTDAAEQLGLHRSNLYRKMRQLGMDASDRD